MKINVNNFEKFVDRHNGPDADQIKQMLATVKANSVDDLIDQTVPQSIRSAAPLDLPQAQTEFDFIDTFKQLAEKNQVFRSYIGLGYYNTVVPPVIQRNILENPGWYTAYTPYQAEIAQGRLQALINFQTMVIELSGMEIANASLLDEGTAAAEAMHMLAGVSKGPKKKANTFFVDENIFPQTIDVLKTRAGSNGTNLVIGSLDTLDLTDPDLYGILVQYPNSDGQAIDYSDLFAAAKEQSVLVAAAADLLALTLLTPPGEMGADAVIGTTQRFGIPMGYGGPHAAFMATKEDYKRQIPGRIIGASLDVNGKNGYRMALQTREQHIKREKATSNICTAQVLLGVMAGMYAVYHGPEGLKQIAARIHGLTQLLDKGAQSLGYGQSNSVYFDTIKLTGTNQEALQKLSKSHKINFRYFENAIGISLNETTTTADVAEVLEILAEAKGTKLTYSVASEAEQLNIEWPENFIRKSEYLTHEVFNKYHSEHDMLRYIKSLENKDLSLVHSMISLGSCTMKLNATSEMMPLSWPEFGNIHPFVPLAQAQGYQELFRNLEAWLTEITGFAGTSLQPNSGAQGEYAGLMVIKAYHESRGEGHRNITIIPTSAHGTNPASAVMAGQKVILVQCDDKGNIDVTDLREKAEANKENLAALMVTYPSTHGVFEESIIEICQIIHDNGGQVYMDGANMNAQVGLTSPGRIGADVCHLNLHKTFCIPHGGGGPGMGPICVAEQLLPFLPGSPLVAAAGGAQSIPAISAAPWGSASILTISYAYIAMMGGDGLTDATKMAILNANYMKERLSEQFDILYTGSQGRCAHEMIVDCRDFKKHGVEVEDIAKRLMDYGFHAPTVSFPVPGTLMIEPTESETKEELDRFCDALLSIRAEVQEVIDGLADAQVNVLKNAPHTAEVVMAEDWTLPYSRTKAAYPLPYVKDNKFWPSVSRVDNAYGDRNLVCSCLPTEAFAEASV